MLRFLVRTGIRRGFIGGSRGWAVVGGVAVAVRAFQRLTTPQPERVFCEQLAPGESLLITREALPSATRRQRAKGRRRASATS